MSRAVDTERSEAAREARIEAGKERLRLAQAILTAYAEGLGIASTAARCCCSRNQVWKVRVWLGIQTGRQHRAGVRTMGHLKRRADIEELQP